MRLRVSLEAPAFAHRADRLESTDHYSREALAKQPAHSSRRDSKIALVAWRVYHPEGTSPWAVCTGVHRHLQSVNRCVGIPFRGDDR